MKSLYLEEYMSWVPVVGSAFGSLLGGFLSDLLLQRMHRSQSSNRVDDNDDNAAGGLNNCIEERLGSINSSQSYATVMGLEGDSSHGKVNIDDQHRISRLSDNKKGVPILPINHLIDVDNTIDKSQHVPDASPSQAIRMLITGCSNLLALPLIVYALQLDFPYCFLILIASGMVSPPVTM